MIPYATVLRQILVTAFALDISMGQQVYTREFVDYNIISMDRSLFSHGTTAHYVYWAAS